MARKDESSTKKIGGKREGKSDRAREGTGAQGAGRVDSFGSEGKKLIIFDLDGTLAPSKAPMDSEMSSLLAKLLEKKKVAVISGGSYVQFQKQFLASLDCPAGLLRNLYLFPTCSTSFYRYSEETRGGAESAGEWAQVYQEALSEEEKKKVLVAFLKTFQEMGYSSPKKTWGQVLEDRETQITFSALGQEAPLSEKEVWDPKQEKRQGMKKVLDKHLPEFEVRIGGTTSIDVTRKGIDKAYGIGQIENHLGISKQEMLFIGDALFPGGNDYPVKEAGVQCVPVSGVEDCKKVIKEML